MLFNLALITAAAALVVLVLLRIVAPATYGKYVLRDSQALFSRSSTAAALTILAVMVVVGVHFGLHLLRDARHESAMHATASQHVNGTHLEAWVGLVCVSVTGIALCLFPTVIVTRLSRRTIILSSADEEGIKKIRAFGRVLGVVFLIVAVLIARQLI